MTVAVFLFSSGKNIDKMREFYDSVNSIIQSRYCATTRGNQPGIFDLSIESFNYEINEKINSTTIRYCCSKRLPGDSSI